MPITLGGALLCADVKPAGKGVAITPVVPIALPQAAKTKNATLPPLFAVVQLFGGEDGQKFTVHTELVYPDNERVTLPDQHLTWSEWSAICVLQVTETIYARGDGEYKLEVSVDGELIVTLPLPVFWADE